jgi:(1->4)-alpha-D-glucan 1-alpha-D-glucosylmutase
VAAYLIKAVREAKQRSSWRDPDEAFEAEVVEFCDRLLADEAALAVLGDVAAAAADIAIDSGLAQVLLRCTSPGVPDTYQGTEGWDLSLVDPDNRRPVDFPARRELQARLDQGGLSASDEHRDGPKAWVLSRALRARRDHPAAFGAGGDYVPLAAEGALAEHVVAFARTAGADAVVTVAPRLPGAVRRAGWGDTAVALPAPGPWTDLLTGTVTDRPVLHLSHALTRLPVALLAPGDR